jgi:hypothetical protein
MLYTSGSAATATVGCPHWRIGHTARTDIPASWPFHHPFTPDGAPTRLDGMGRSGTQQKAGDHAAAERLEA